jgi:predicted dehydrogenase
MRIVVAGAGLIGQERIEAVQRLATGHAPVELLCVVDPAEAVRKRVEATHSVPTSPDLAHALSRRPDWVFICVPHDAAPALAISALASGTNVLIEKPLGRDLSECDAIAAELTPNTKLNVGFNYRFYAGIAAAILDARAGRFGKLVSVNMTLGHGNSPGMEKTWKLDPMRCGGGCLIDPGIHLLDLVLLLAQGQPSVSAACTWDGFWNTGIEEEAHVLLVDEAQTTFNLDISLVRWRSTFRLEINGVDGYGIVEGRGRSYGPQTYRRGKRWGWQAGVAQAESEGCVIDRDPGTDSFLHETAEVLGLRRTDSGGSLGPCDHKQASNVMHLLSRVQRAMRRGDPVQGLKGIRS